VSFLPRLQLNPLKESLKIWRVILIEGPRQCGKTTLAKHCLEEGISYRTLDNKSVREAANFDPHQFVIYKGKTLIIDEVQRAPDLLTAIKMQVDENTRPGQYLLTGSANISEIPSIQESLAGRIHKVRLRPLTQGEIEHCTRDILADCFLGSFQDVYDIDRNTMLEYAFRGGFPEVLNLSQRQRKTWHLDYVDTLLNRDLREVLRIQRRHAMRSLVEILASWSSKLMDLQSIGSSLGVTRPTLNSYLGALETIYLTETLPCWTATDYARVGKSPKFFFCDSGLVTSILGWSLDNVLLDSDRSGKLLETFIFNELSAHVDAQKPLYRLFHYRDRVGHEIDFLITREDGALLGIEVKASRSISYSDFKHLSWFQSNLAKENSFTGIVFYAGEHTLSFGNSLWAVPIGALWK
jgi:predicted AAA+ superfamily ATPase